MAKNTSAKKSASSTKVTRIKASDSQSKKKSLAASSNTNTKTPNTTEQTGRSSRLTALRRMRHSKTSHDKSRRNIFGPIGRYFKGAWEELRQVRWPDRRETWSMTGALLVFTLFFVIVILLLDAAFKYMFQVILG